MCQFDQIIIKKKKISKGQKIDKISTCISCWLEWYLQVGVNFFENCSIKKMNLRTGLQETLSLSLAQILIFGESSSEW